MVSFDEIKKSNDNFLEKFGRENVEAGFIPECVKTDFSIAEKALKNVGTKADALEIIDDLIYSYGILNESRKNNFPDSKYISNGFSNIILLRDDVVDENCFCMSSKSSLISLRGTNFKGSSPATFAIRKAFESCVNEKDSDKINKIVESVKSLIATIVEYFDPSVVAILLSGLYKEYSETTTVFKDLFSYDNVKKLFETLIIHENIVYNNKYLSADSSVGNIFFKGVFCYEKSSLDLAKKILEKGKELKDILSISDRIPFDYYKENCITKTFIECMLFQSDNTALYREKAKILKDIRENITKWIKHKDLSERPEMPEYFEFINMGNFVSTLYSSGIYILGDIEKFTSEKEALMDDINKEISDIEKNEEKSEEDNKKLDNLKQKLASVKENYLSYLHLKSSISFLIEECTSNEKIATMVFEPENVVNMILREPGVDNAMHDTHTCLSSLFIKRDFAPVGSTPINPYYIHYYNNDIDQSSKEALYMSDILSSRANPFNRSLIATSGIKDMYSLSLAIAAMKINIFESSNVVKEFIDTFKFACDEIKSGYKDFKEDGNIEIEGFEEYISDLEIISNKEDPIEFDILKNINSKTKDILDKISKCDDPIKLQLLNYSYFEYLKTYTDWYISYVSKVENFFGEFKFIASNANGENDKCFSSAAISINENKPIKNFWPITQQYEFEIKEEPILKDPTDPNRDIKPGDIYHQRYGSRYSAAKNCD